MTIQEAKTEFGLSARSVRILQEIGIQEISELHKFTVCDILRRKGCGRKTFNQIDRLAKALKIDFAKNSIDDTFAESYRIQHYPWEKAY